jgi:pseudouridine-5'-phosphate glycosidase
MKPPIAVARRIQEALGEGRAVVALETTLVTHGLPHPQGLETAQALEAEVRQQGAEPATIGVLDGVVRVGLAASEIERLATTQGVAKLTLANLAGVVAAGGAGSTTVSATLWAAHAAGIAVLATGGIGGVHRGAAESGDVSADLTALSRWGVAVVCSGAKAILDLPRTLEMLETLGVPVLGYRTAEFPAFYRRSSGLPVDARFDTLPELARALRAHAALGLGTGVLIGNPVPAGSEVPEEVYEPALRGALAGVAARGLRGRAVTPFLLDQLRLGTEGKSVFSNLALLRSNAAVAGALAVALSEPENGGATPAPPTS